MVWISIALLLLGVYVTRQLFRHFHEAKLLRLREIVHAERLSAIDNGVEPPDSPTREIEAALSSGDHARVLDGDSEGVELRWIRLAALALGLVGLLGGVGTAVGLYLVSDQDVQGTWPLGLVPVFMAVGLLLFVRLTRGIEESSSGGEESR